MPNFDLDRDDGSGFVGASGDERNISASPLLPIPPTPAKPDDKLCDVCKALDLTPSRFLISPSDNIRGITPGDPDISLGGVEGIKKKRSCPLCRLVLSLLGGDSFPSIQDRKPVQVGMGWVTAGPTPGAYPVESYTPVTRVLQVYAYAGNKKATVMGSGPLFPRITLLANDAPRSSKLYLMRVIDDQIDFNMVRNALKLCNKWHGSACDKSKAFHAPIEDPAIDIPHFRLIDTTNNCVVLPHENCRYATLSYVWGKIDPLRLLKANVAQLEEPGSLLRPENRDRLPLTIRDAMEVVRRLHLRYLWVDSLCIVQDDVGPGGSKMSAISKMDLVYGGSYVVITAATGKDANAGLPGVWPGTRGSGATQLIEEIKPGLRLGYNGPRETRAGETTYFDRAWTFQEQRLASRSLIFQAGRVIFRCQKSNGWTEDVVFEDTMETSPKESPSEDASNQHFDIKNFSDLISSYSALSLTVESDIYHAFAGMSRHFKAGLEANLCHGISDTLFDWFLLWIPKGLNTRRALAPSWSWSGWRGGMIVKMIDQIFAHDPAENRKAIRRRTWIIWYQRVGHDTEDCRLIWSPPNKAQASSEARNFYGGSIRARFAIDCSQTVPTPRKLVGAPTYLEDSHNPLPGSGFLQFWTVSVTFALSLSENLDYDRGTHRSGRVRAGVFGSGGRELCSILLEPEWAKTNVPKAHEFILLSEGRGGFYSGGKVTWKYIMMLLEWHGDWAERVSLCGIERDDLSEALGQGPIWKEIILG